MRLSYSSTYRISVLFDIEQQLLQTDFNDTFNLRLTQNLETFGIETVDILIDNLGSKTIKHFWANDNNSFLKSICHCNQQHSVKKIFQTW